jgi:hypothetical protein
MYCAPSSPSGRGRTKTSLGQEPRDFNAWLAPFLAIVPTRCTSRSRTRWRRATAWPIRFAARQCRPTEAPDSDCPATRCSHRGAPHERRSQPSWEALREGKRAWVRLRPGIPAWPAFLSHLIFGRSRTFSRCLQHALRRHVDADYHRWHEWLLLIALRVTRLASLGVTDLREPWSCAFGMLYAVFVGGVFNPKLVVLHRISASARCAKRCRSGLSRRLRGDRPDLSRWSACPSVECQPADSPDRESRHKPVLRI